MAPNATLAPTGVLFENERLDNIKDTQKDIETERCKLPIIWPGIFYFTAFHLQAFYAVYVLFTSGTIANLLTFIYSFVIGYSSGLGITAGVHRLWCHRSYKAKLPLQILLMILNSFVGQESILDWAVHHRVHHKYSDTNADPQNINRGFFFAHIGWLIVHRDPEYVKCKDKLDFSDLKDDPVVSFQDKYYYLLFWATLILPLPVPVYFWGETWLNSWLLISALRYVIVLNFTLLINSGAHQWGNRPYDKGMEPRDHFFITLLTLGEGWHNYHHTFPWDYRNRDLVDSSCVTTAFIDLMAKIGWAYDLKKPTEAMVQSRVQRTGDGTHVIWGDMTAKKNNIAASAVALT